MSPLSSGSLTNHENRCDLAITLIKYLFPARTMIDNECNILSNMSKTEFREFRSLMVEMVLHTGEMVEMVRWWDGGNGEMVGWWNGRDIGDDKMVGW